MASPFDEEDRRLLTLSLSPQAKQFLSRLPVVQWSMFV
jgi:hypothetical protein